MNKIKRIALVGGSGFIGSHLAPELTQRGYSTRILTRRRERNRALLVLPTCDIVQTDVHDPDALRTALDGCDAVISLAGILNEGSRNSESFESVHVDLPRKVAAACVDLGIKRLLHMSALNASPEGPSLYLSTKHAGETAAMAASEHGVAVTSFRPSVIFGPGDSFILRFAQLLRMVPGVMPLACADAKMQPVYVRDVVQAFSDAVEDESTHGQIYDLAGPKVYTLRELVEYTATVCDLDRDVWALPDGIARLQASIMGMIPGKPFSMDNYRSLQVDSILSGENGLSAFGIEPTPMDTVVPNYLGTANREGRNSRFRQEATRR